MTASNHWGTYGSSVASWYVEFPARMWLAWPDVLDFADTALEIGRSEDVLSVDGTASRMERGHRLFRRDAPTARVSVVGANGVEDRRTSDVGAELLRLRPELQHVPRVPALSIDGPQSTDRGGPVYMSITTCTDIWFPFVVGINDDRDDVAGFDNAGLAARHTVRLNRFLTQVRAAATERGGTWSHDAEFNTNYTDEVTDDGIVLPPAGITIDRVAGWAERICSARTTDPADMLRRLGISGTIVSRFDALAIEPPPSGTRGCTSIIRNGVFNRLDLTLSGASLTRADLEGRFGTGLGGPRLHWDSDHVLTFAVAVAGAPYRCTILANFAEEPKPSTAVAGMSLRREKATTT